MARAIAAALAASPCAGTRGRYRVGALYCKAGQHRRGHVQSLAIVTELQPASKCRGDLLPNRAGVTAGAACHRAASPLDPGFPLSGAIRGPGRHQLNPLGEQIAAAIGGLHCRADRMCQRLLENMIREAVASTAQSWKVERDPCAVRSPRPMRRSTAVRLMA